MNKICHRFIEKHLDNIPLATEKINRGEDDLSWLMGKIHQ
jgi:hypothetical protein